MVDFMLQQFGKIALMSRFKLEHVAIEILVADRDLAVALNLRVERIGHGFTASQDADLIEELAQRQIPVELCITSNLRTGVCKSVAEHPTKNYFDQGVMITLNTDDPALFGTTLSHEYQLAQETFGFTDEHLRELARNSFEASFLPAEKKLELLSLFDAAAAR